jgi:NTE family protein
VVDFEQQWARIPSGLEAPDRELEERTAGAGLALSGGGFRAMLFHVGALRRLHEIGALGPVDRISSVSGGSITAAHLALQWDDLHAPGATVSTFVDLVQQPLFDFASSKLDVKSGLLGLVTPRTSIADKITGAYDELFAGARLQQLPDRPRFVFCSTNMGSGALVRFAKPYSADYRIGRRDHLDLDLGSIVAASAAFPPFLSPKVIELDDDQALTEQFPLEPGEEPPPLADTAPYTHRLELTDGGVYDNLGLQPVEKYHTLLVSDAGGPFAFSDSVPANWLGHMVRSWLIADNQVRSLRRQGLVDELDAERRNGAFWGIRTPYHHYAKRAIDVDPGWADVLQSISTRLWPMPEAQRKRLINWAYCLTDAAIRSYVDADLEPEAALPYPDEPLSRPPSDDDRKWWHLW